VIVPPQLGVAKVQSHLKNVVVLLGGVGTAHHIVAVIVGKSAQVAWLIVVPFHFNIHVIAVVSFVLAGIACLWSTLAHLIDVQALALSPNTCVLGDVLSRSNLSVLTVSQFSIHSTFKFPLAGAVVFGANQCDVVLALPVVTSVNVIVVSA
jgi:hypothetical protein